MSANSLVFFETRPLDEIFRDIVINKHKIFLDKSWELTICTNTEQFDKAKDLFGDINLIGISKIHNVFEYNSIILDDRLWDKLKVFKKVLVAHKDSEILRSGIDQFMQFDYIGAPWKQLGLPRKGGNGGFSLRTPEIMLKTLSKRPPHGMHEDVFFSILSGSVGGNVAAYNDCTKFSCETIFSLNTFGCHAIDKWLTPEQCEQIRTQYNE